MGNNTSRTHLLVAVFPVILLTGCAVGPDFRPPAPPEVSGYIAGSTSAASADSQRIVTGQESNWDWWHALGSAQLNALIGEALAGHPTLVEAEATLRRAEELSAARAGSTRYPRVEGSMAGQRQRFNPAASGLAGEAREFSLYNAEVGGRYVFDLFGGNRRALEALAARGDYQRCRLAGARLTLAANIAATAITEARLAGQIAAMENILRSREEQLELSRKRLRLGQAAPDEVLALQTVLEQTRAGIPPLRDQHQQNRHLLAVLVGRAPGANGLPSFTLADFSLPPALPLLVPSELVRVRPDIRAAEALLHAANAEYGAAVAKLYPQLDLSAGLGSQTLSTGALFGAGSAVWNLMAQLSQPLFNPGLAAEKRAALAAFDAALASYQAVVLEALRTVADVLRALENDSERLAALAAAEKAAGQFLASAQRRYALGATGYYDLLTAQQQAEQTRLDVLEGRARRLLNSVAFYQAMGGGRPAEGTEGAGITASLPP
ncbi:efflux transporter outer membrane subunit [Thiovibrio sp. JS02]